MGCLEFHLGVDSCIVGFDPALQAEAPEISVFEARKVVGGHGGNEVVALLGTELQELVGNLHANGVHTSIFRAGVTRSGPEKSGHRGFATRNQFAA